MAAASALFEAPCLSHLDADMQDCGQAVLVFDVALTDGDTKLEAVLTANPNVRAVAIGAAESAPEILAWAEVGASGYVTRDGSVALSWSTR